MKKNFTLLEVIIVIVILGVLATLGIPIYNKMMEDSKTKACETNLRVILGAIEVRTLETDSFPGSLSQLKDSDLEKAWAKILKQPGSWKIKLAYYMVDFDQRGLAYAQEWIGRYVGDRKFLRCPSDRRAAIDIPADQAGGSYGINAAHTGITFSAYQGLGAGVIIVADSDDDTFTGSNLPPRHRYYGQHSVTLFGQGLNHIKTKKTHPGVLD